MISYVKPLKTHLDKGITLVEMSHVPFPPSWKGRKERLRSFSLFRHISVGRMRVMDGMGPGGVFRIDGEPGHASAGTGRKGGAPIRIGDDQEFAGIWQCVENDGGAEVRWRKSDIRIRILVFGVGGGGLPGVDFKMMGNDGGFVFHHFWRVFGFG